VGGLLRFSIGKDGIPGGKGCEGKFGKPAGRPARLPGMEAAGHCRNPSFVRRCPAAGLAGRATFPMHPFRHENLLATEMF
jgi:hypothetical protein